MINNFPNETVQKIWKLIELHQENNIKVPLGLFTLMINADPTLTPEIDLNQGFNAKERDLEF